MPPDIEGESLQALLNLYNKEIDFLKQKLLNGESWENLRDQRRNITELAISIHKLHNYIVPEKLIKNQTSNNFSEPPTE
jgi:hypothetical protein